MDKVRRAGILGDWEVCAGSLPNKLKRECAKNTPEGSTGEAEGSTIFYMGEALRIGPYFE